MSEDVRPMDGKVVVVTGANSGIGKHTCIGLARAGARVVMACRNLERSEPALREVRVMSFNDDVELMHLDLASFASISSFAGEFVRRYERLDVLVNNAGVVLRRRQETADGLEMTFGVNHVGPFLLTKLLAARLAESAPSRVVTVSSHAHFQVRRLRLDDLQSENRRYQAWLAYARTKLENILFARELARRLNETGVTSNAHHPGLVATELGQSGDMYPLFSLSSRLIRAFITTPQRGATNSILLASSPELEATTGEYFVNGKPGRSSRVARDAALARELWEATDRLVAPALGTAGG